MFKLTLKIFLLFSLVIALVIIGISSGIINISKINNNSPEEKLFLSKLEKMGNFKLVTFYINYTVKDTIKNDTSGAENIKTRGYSLALINGSVDACINLKRIGKDDIKENKDTAFIKLPIPVLCNTEIDYNQSTIYHANLNSRILNQNYIEKYFPNAINNLKAEAIRKGILDQAKDNALQILQPIIEEILNKNIVITFEEE